MGESGYALLDCGNGRRLESFGEVICDRPAPMAQKNGLYSPELWKSAALRFIRGDGWSPDSFEPWNVDIAGITFRLQPSSQGQIGVFPEQQENWQWLREIIGSCGRECNVLNCFAHTGGSTLAAAQAGANVCHVDAAKSAVNRARENAGLNDLQDAPIRWIVEDAVKFMERELRRGNRYEGIILDPPAFGRMGKSIWKLEKQLPHLLELTQALLSDAPLFLLVTCHPQQWDAAQLRAEVDNYCLSTEKPFTSESGESVLRGESCRLDLGFYYRRCYGTC